MLASVYTDNYERGRAMGIALGGLALGLLGKQQLGKGLSSGDEALHTLLCKDGSRRQVPPVVEDKCFLCLPGPQLCSLLQNYH
jgi:hypothetical protein